MLRKGSVSLRRESINIFVEYWDKLPPAALRAYIDSTDPSGDAEPLDRLADVFAGHVMGEPKAVQDYLLASLNTLSLASASEPQCVTAVSVCTAVCDVRGAWRFRSARRA